MTLKEIRINNNITQENAAKILNIPVRTLRRYELDENYGNNFKREMLKQLLGSHFEINETKGLLTIESIKSNLTELFNKQYKGKVDYCYLFGSYAKGKAKEDSDVDLYVSTSLLGLEFIGLIERCREVLNKKVDVLRNSELVNNIDLLNEIMKDGIKIFG